MTSGSRPLILISCSNTLFDIPGIGSLQHQAVFERYIDTVISTLGSVPLLLPALEDLVGSINECLRIADGVLLTGDASNITPEIYGSSSLEEPSIRDKQRDGIVIPLIRSAINEGVPLLGICRGLQEINVALGGSLYQKVHSLPGRRDHRASREKSFPDRYLPLHPLCIHPESWLESILLARSIDPSSLYVNSLHGQAVDRVGKSIVVEATADDGIVEAIRVENSAALAIGVQWHTEWYIRETPLHAAILDEFRQACFERQASRRTTFDVRRGVLNEPNMGTR